MAGTSDDLFRYNAGTSSWDNISGASAPYNVPDGQLWKALQFGTSTVNIFGEISVGSVATFYCRQESRNRSVERSDGTYENSAQPYLVLDSDVLTTGTPDFDTRVWLPGYSPSTAAYGRKPKRVEFCIDVDGGVDHVEIEI